MRLSVALPNSFFAEEPLKDKIWSGSGLKIEVNVQAYHCGEEERLVVSDPTIRIGQHYYNAPTINGEIFKTDYQEALDYMARMKAFIESHITRAIRERLDANRANH